MSKDEWQTPQELFDKLNEEFHFNLDVACNVKNCLCENGIYIENENAIENSWWIWNCVQGDLFRDKEITCWMNPPYSKPNLDLFTKKAYEESQKGCTVVGLLPCDCSTGWFKKYVMKAAEIRFCSKRIQFIDPDTGKRGKNGPTFGSIIVVWKPYYKTPGTPAISIFECENSQKIQLREEKPSQTVLAV